ncbi:unnamed protein product [Effrenium voratum]|nr:unnamed protein product [Effrenium voratum]
MPRQRLIGLFIDGNWLLQGVWFNLLTTLGCVHSMLFGAFHMDFYMARGLSATEVAAVHSFFSLWNPLNDIVAGLLVDEWVARGFGSRLLLAVWANAGYAATTWFAFQELSLPAWVQYALAISLSDGFAAVAGAVNGLILIEQTSEDRQRIQIQRLNSLFGCLEWLVMSGAYWLWDARPGEGQAFRGYLSAVCGGSALVTLLSVQKLQPSKPMRAAHSESFWQRMRQFLRLANQHGNFWRYAALTAALEAENVFFRQFDVIIIRLLLNSWLTCAKVLLMIGDPLCGCLSFALTWVAERPGLGVYWVTLGALRVRMLVSLVSLSLVAVLWVLDGRSVAASCLFCVLMVLLRAATRPAANLGAIAFASVIQEHSLLAQELCHPLTEDDAGKYWMLRAALVKPLNSLGPVLGTSALAAAGYRPTEGTVTPELWWLCAWLPAVAWRSEGQKDQ